MGDEFALYFVMTGGVTRARSAMFVYARKTPFTCRVEFVEFTSFHDDILVIET